MDPYSFMVKKQKEQIAIEKQMHQSRGRSKDGTTRILLFLFVIMSVFLSFVALVKTFGVDEKLQTFQAQTESQLKEQNRDIVFIMGKNYKKSSLIKDKESLVRRNGMRIVDSSRKMDNPCAGSFRRYT